ncbi:MAG: hypothetical protein QM754_15175 [Tepidisphaeraceae bacterium]
MRKALDVAGHANMWRISDDFWDSWKALREQFDRCAKWTKYTGPGYYPDADMLPVGAVRIGQKAPWTHFTHDEQYTLMSLWSMAKSPLMIGADMPQNDQFTLDLLTNKEVIEIDQHSKNGHEVERDGDKIVWLADAPTGADKYVAVFNVGSKPKDSTEAGKAMTVSLAKLGFGGRTRVRDLWKKQDEGVIEGELKAVVPWHGVKLVRLASE